MRSKLLVVITQVALESFLVPTNSRTRNNIAGLYSAFGELVELVNLSNGCKEWSWLSWLERVLGGVLRSVSGIRGSINDGFD